MDSTAWTVILGAAAGQPLQRDEFARRYSVAARAYLGARWSGSPLHAGIDDAVQEVFVECFKEGVALSRVEKGRTGGFRGFLYGLIRNVARRFEERWTRRATDGQMASSYVAAGDDDSASRAFDRAWARSIMKQATELQAERVQAGGESARQRVELLRLRFTESLPIREIAALWEQKPTQVQYEYRCARDEFQVALIDVVRRHDPACDAAGVRPFANRGAAGGRVRSAREDARHRSWRRVPCDRGLRRPCGAARPDRSVREPAAPSPGRDACA